MRISIVSTMTMMMMLLPRMVLSSLSESRWPQKREPYRGGVLRVKGGEEGAVMNTRKKEATGN